MIHKKTNNGPQIDKQWSTKRQTMVHKKTNNGPQIDKQWSTNRQTMVHKKLHRKHRATRTPQKTMVNAEAPEG